MGLEVNLICLRDLGKKIVGRFSKVSQMWKYQGCSLHLQEFKAQVLGVDVKSRERQSLE